MKVNDKFHLRGLQEMGSCGVDLHDEAKLLSTLWVSLFTPRFLLAIHDLSLATMFRVSVLGLDYYPLGMQGDFTLVWDVGGSVLVVGCWCRSIGMFFFRL